jgi:hypothetical protein
MHVGSTFAIIKFLKLLFSECRICFEEVDNLEFFYSHVKIHSGKTQFECKYCFLGKFFLNLIVLCCKYYVFNFKFKNYVVLIFSIMMILNLFWAQNN